MPTCILRKDRPKGGQTNAGKRHDLKAVRWHEATFAVQLRVYPFFGRGNLPHEAGTPLV